MIQLVHIIIASLLLPLPTSEETKLMSSISEVTVYTQSASVTRQSKSISISGSNTLLVLSELSPFVDQNSLQVKLKGEGVINSVKFRKNYLNSEKVYQQLTEMESELKVKSDSLVDLELRLKALDSREDFLITNKEIKGAAAVLTLQQLREVDQYYSGQLYQIYSERHQLTADKILLDTRSKALKRQMHEIAPKEEQTPLDLLVNVSAKGSGDVSLEVTYQVQRAGWYTTYDLRASDIVSPVELIQKANVFQNTGVDWTDVKLSFSNENIQNSKTMPELYPMYLPVQNRNSNGQSSAQNRTTMRVHGYIYDLATKEALPFVTVSIDGTALGTSTDFNGYYELDVPPGYSNMVRADFLGYTSARAQVSQARTDLYLQESSEVLDEVVVSGYRVPLITSESINKLPSKNINALAATTAGLSTVDGSDISVRGSRSNSTYIYIDGMKVRGDKNNLIPQSEITRKRNRSKYGSAIPSSTLDESELNFKFTLEEPYTVASDGKNNEIGLRSIEMKADFTYRAIPKLSQSVYLTGYIDEWEDKNLTVGNMNLYFEGGYIGQSLLNPRQLQDSMVLSLGVDSKIQIERKRVKSFSKRVAFNTKKCTEVQYEITVKNQKTSSVTLEIWDQIPVSTLKEIEVTKDEITAGFDIDDLSGIGNWKVNVDSKGEDELKIGYEVKYPRRFNFVL